MSSLEPMLSLRKNLSFKTFIDIFFPEFCEFCDKHGEIVCEDCIVRAIKSPKNLCHECQKPSPDGFTHPGCISKYSIDRSIVISNYNSKVKRIIQLFKYYNVKSLAKYLAKLFVPPLQTIEATELVPIPLHKSRIRERGYNQVELIINELILLNNSFIKRDILYRSRSTTEQNKLSKKARFRNVKGAFGTFGYVPARVILIDDLTTSGATLSEACKALKKAGTKEVISISLARGE